MNTKRYYGLILATVFLVGMAQYAPVAIDAVMRGDVQLWNMDAQARDDAGSIKYVKDLFLVLFAICWPIAIARRQVSPALSRMLFGYFVWLMTFVAIGTIAFILEWSPFFFFPAGLRWVMMLHASFGLFVFAQDMPHDHRTQRMLLLLLVVMSLVDIYIVMRQLALGASMAGVAFAQGRLTGLFSNAGVAGMFGLALANIALILDRGGAVLRMGLIFEAMFIALASGTRFTVISIGLVAGLVIWELCADRARRIDKLLLITLAVPFALAAAVMGYASLIDAVGRGDMIASQLEDGGRIANLGSVISILAAAEPGELMIGRGLGIATNTAIGPLMARGIDPFQYRFNWLIDDAFITLIYQAGLLGLTVFVTGMIVFFRKVRPPRPDKMRKRFYLILLITLFTCFGGSAFEQYFLVTTLMIAFGDTYWRSLREERVRQIVPVGRTLLIGRA